MEAAHPPQNPQVTPIQDPRSKVLVSRSSAPEPWPMMLETWLLDALNLQLDPRISVLEPRLLFPPTRERTSRI